MDAPDRAGNWHLRLFRTSVLKQQKLEEITRMLPDVTGRTCLDIGGDNGVVSFFLRKTGATWYSADLSDTAVRSIKSIVGGNVFKIGEKLTPFDNDMFDLVVIIDFLEHIRDDGGFAAELSRIIKPGGVLIVNVPHLKRFSIVRKIRQVLGLSDEKHGHLRPGYTLGSIKTLFGGMFELEAVRTYSRFFTGTIDAVLNFAYGLLSREEAGAKGTVVTAKDVDERGGAFRLYSVIYPLLWLLSKLDVLLFFTRGHMLITRFKICKGTVFSPRRSGRQCA